MSLSIFSEPDTSETSSTYRPLFLDVSSDTAAIVRVIADVYINGILETTIEKEPTLGTLDQFRLDVSEITKKYVTSEFETTSSFLEAHNSTTSASVFTLALYEVINSGTTLTTTWAEDGAGTGGLSTTQQYFFNGVNQHLQDLDMWKCDGSTKHFLTNRPENSNIARAGIYHCGILPNTESYRALIYVKEFSGFNNTGSVLAANTSALGFPSFRKLSFTIDTEQLNPLTKSILYLAKDNAGDKITESVSQNIVDVCDGTTHLFWQNHWGEFDQYYFNGNKLEKTKNRTKSITNRLNLSYTSDERGKIDIRKTNTRLFEIFTNTTNPGVANWLAEIGETVDAFIMVGADRVPVNIVSVTPLVLNEEEQVYQISVKYTLANERILQLG